MATTTDQYGITITTDDKSDKGFKGAAKGAENLKNKYDGVSRSADKVAKSTTGMSKVTKIFMSLGLAALAMKLASSFIRAASAATDLGDQMSKASTKLGIGVETLSQLRFAAQRSGTTFEAVSVALKTMAKNVTLNSAEFRKWGLELKTTEGNVKTIDQLLRESADIISNLDSATLRAAAAQDLFGRSGIDLLPMLTKGAAGIEELTQAADELGVTMSTKFATQSAEYKDALLDAKMASEALTRETVESLLPAMTATLDAVKDGLVWWREHKEGIEAVSTALKKVSPLHLLYNGIIAASEFAFGSAAEAQAKLLEQTARNRGMSVKEMAAANKVTAEKIAAEEKAAAAEAIALARKVATAKIAASVKAAAAERERILKLKLLEKENIAAGERMSDKEIERGELLQQVYAANALRRLILEGETELALKMMKDTAVVEDIARQEAVDSARKAGAEQVARISGNALAQMITDSKNAKKHFIQASLSAMEAGVNTAIAVAAARAGASGSWGGPVAAAVSASLVVGLLRGIAAKAMAGAARGGEIVGGTPGKDSVHVLAQRGEGFLTVGQTDMIKRLGDAIERQNVLAAGSGGSSGGTDQAGLQVIFPSMVPVASAEHRRMVRDALRLGR